LDDWTIGRFEDDWYQPLSARRPVGKSSSRSTVQSSDSSAAHDEVARVQAALEHYAQRGSFRSFSTTPRTASKTEFAFSWFRDVTFRVVFDRTRRTLTFVDMLPGIAPRSEMDRALRAFVKVYTSSAVPEHRRVDRRRVAVAVVNRAGAESLVFRFHTKDIAYAVRKAVHLAHDILQDFLNDGRYVQYNVDHFNLNPEMA
jgi:hypothetical protein